MDGRIKKLEEVLMPILQEKEMVIDSISYEKEGKYYFLRIVLDRVSGIDLDSIVMATNLINPILDDLDLFEDSYILDVLSKEREQ
ncbi:MAG: hypothetical protein HFH86_03910 [Bacilli bacterium]|jgi:ribosome maturation factor RimP|nr:hypothetical protein [Bacilli bacterium]